jgi:PAS domain S-box-containing protein
MRDISARKAAEDAVHASEALLRGVFDHTPDSILVNSVAADGTFLLETYNPAAAAAIGFPVGVMNGKPLHDVLLPAAAAKVKDDLEQCLASGQVLAFEDVAMFGKGRRTWDVTLTPIFDDRGRAVRIIATARETTEKKLAADLVRGNRERYQLIADNVADLVVRLDRDLACGFVSPASRDLLGCEPEELVALPLVEIVHPGDRGVFQQDMRTVLTFGSRRRDASWPAAAASSWRSAISRGASRSRTNSRRSIASSRHSPRRTALPGLPTGEASTRSLSVNGFAPRATARRSA